MSTGLVKDATIFANNTGNSNGAGPGMFVGSNSGPSARRGFVRVDVASYSSGILVGKTIDAVRLILTVGMKAGSGGGDGGGGGSCTGGDGTSRTIDIFRVIDVSGTSTGDWGESATTSAGSSIGGTGQGATAGAGDATWASRAHSSAWASAGASSDYNTTASDTQSTGTTCPVQITFSGTNMVSDVTGWLNGSFPNRGWILKSQAEGSSQSFRAFWTKEGELLGYTIGSPAITHYGPVLEIDYH
ncbi:MAG: hypothetical protein QM706_14300 [Nitrospira sp.]